LITGLLPDVTIRVANFERPFYSNRLMQMTFHELAHASHFRKVGQGFWLDLMMASMSTEGCPGYGCGTGTDDGNIAVAESWAEFLGTDHALRNQPNGMTLSTSTGGWMLFADLLEFDRWFGSNWIPSGIYNDLRDVTNADPGENLWDRTGGLTIAEMYDAFGPHTDQICFYFNEINTRYPGIVGVGGIDLFSIFNEHGYGCL
jgi:hypothetical protein